MYLIAAEASGDIRYLETLRANRGYATDPLPAGANLQDEITKEYQKEFIAEGQLFYYYKRRNMAAYHVYQHESGYLCTPRSG